MFFITIVERIEIGDFQIQEKGSGDWGIEKLTTNGVTRFEYTRTISPLIGWIQRTLAAMFFFLEEPSRKWLGLRAGEHLWLLKMFSRLALRNCKYIKINSNHLLLIIAGSIK